MIARHPVNVSLACFPGLPLEASVEKATVAAASNHDGLGPLSIQHVQICPQVATQMTEDLAHSLRSQSPTLNWRLHANVWVRERRVIRDLADWDLDRLYFHQLAIISKALDASAYTAHAGLRSKASLAEVLDATRAAADLFQCRVGIEGHYPTLGDQFLLSSWDEYATLLEARVDFALDLSHLHIVATASGKSERGLVTELLASEHCIEVHVSGNDGTRDQHAGIDGNEWWLNLLGSANQDATIFTEEIRERQVRRLV